MTLRSYLTGFLLSLSLTAAAFGLASWHLSAEHLYPPHTVVAGGLVLLALVQLLVQLVFFLHVGKRSSAWNLSALIFALFIVMFLVLGTLWIMNNLQHSQQTPFEGLPSPQTEL